MSARQIADPSQHGWVDLGNGKWGWAGEGSGEPPVTSVNDKIGDVVLEASDVGALPDTYTPPSTDLSSYYTKTEADNAFKPIGYSAPVDSVNNKTGAVVLTAADVGASTFSGSYDDLTDKPPASSSPWTTETYGIKAEQSVAYIKGTDNSEVNHGLAHLTVEAFDHVMNTNAPNILAKSKDAPKIGWLQEVQDSEALYLGCNSYTDAGGRFNALQFGAGRSAKTQNTDFGGAWQYSNTGWVRNMRINGTYTGTNVSFRDSAGVTARDLIDVFVALRDAVTNVNESDPIAAMSSMRSAITTTSESLIQKFEAIHEAVADELELRRIAMMEAPEGVDGTEPPE